MLKDLGYPGVGHVYLDNIPERLRTLDAADLKLFAIILEVNVNGSYDSRFQDVLRRVNGRNVQFWLVVKGAKSSDHSFDTNAVAVIRQLAETAKGTDADLLLYPHQDYWIERIEDAVRVADKVDRPNVGVVFNLCHWLRVDQRRDYKPLLKQAMPRLRAVTINGADTFDPQPGWDRYIQPLDSGSFDVPAFVNTLNELGFRGRIGLQCYGVGGDAGDHLRRSVTAWLKMNRSKDQISP